jgi:hypothetical protein
MYHLGARQHLGLAKSIQDKIGLQILFMLVEARKIMALMTQMVLKLREG